MKRIFLTKNFSEDEPLRYFSIDEAEIKRLNLFETYGNYGQEVGNYNAGDYCLDNSGCDAVLDCTKAIAEKFGISDLDEIKLIDNDGEFIIEPGYGEQYGFNETEVNAFIKEWRKENETFTEVEGFTFWNGHNWQTITTAQDFGEPSHNIVDDKDLISELNKAIEEKDFESGGFGCKVYKGNDYVVIKSQWQGTWYEYELVSESDYDFLQKQSSALPEIN